ncbi:hypothetical protein O6H91_07G037900 [Diphasiastrum complanatum]|uniref:Uncharacterized protein n=1 Tax=Diphasiastrum complanatum TaxID=34168 RepID=A0ACC2D458_DIPCM|nr:hypothetical protein O6H91_07G037900 [Diphasiastrum complanatum]
MEQRGGDDGEDSVAASSSLPFTLHLDKSLPCAVVRAAWNPEKDLLAMVTADHQLNVHRFNWQRLWSVSPGKKVTTICWRPDGKAIAVGHEDGSIALHDVENGELLRKIGTHKAAVQCLCWAEDRQSSSEIGFNSLLQEDRALRFFPPPPKAPAMPGTVPAFELSLSLGSNEEIEAASRKGTTRVPQQFLNVLCSGDSDGIVCLNAFGVFPIGKLDVKDLPEFETEEPEKFLHRHQVVSSILKVSLSTDLRQMTLLCNTSFKDHTSMDITQPGLYAVSVDTSLLGDRRTELRQVARQAPSVEELLDVLHISHAVMQKHWFDATSSFAEKFEGFSALLREHGSYTKPKEEFLSLLACGSASAALHQFLAVSLGEGGLKRLAKSIDSAGRELHIILAEHLQPAAELIAFRLGELSGLARWRARMQKIGLEEGLISRAMEDAGMVLVQIERFLRILSDMTGQFRLFFLWLTKSLRQLNGEHLATQAEQLPFVNSAAVAAFLRCQFETDPIRPHLASVSDNVQLELSVEDEERMDEIALLGGFEDTKFLQKTLSQQIDQLCLSCHEAFSRPVGVISPNLCFKSKILLCRLPNSSVDLEKMSLSLTHLEEKVDKLPVQVGGITKSSLLYDYICFKRHTDSSSIGVLCRFGGDLSEPLEMRSHWSKLDAITLHLEKKLQCVDLALYKQQQLVLLIAESALYGGGSSQAWLMIFQLEDLPFMSLSAISTIDQLDLFEKCESIGAVVEVGLNDGRARVIPQSDVVPPLAVSASRGLACIFVGQRRALLYDLEEDEDVKSE